AYKDTTPHVYIEPLAADTIALVNGAVSNLVSFVSLGINASDVSLYSLEAVTWKDDALGGYKAKTSDADVEGYKIVLEAKGRKYEYHSDGTNSYLNPLTKDTINAVKNAISNLAEFIGRTGAPISTDEITVDSVYRAVWQDGKFDGFNPGGAAGTVTEGYRIFLKYKDATIEYRTTDDTNPVVYRDPMAAKYEAISAGQVFNERGKVNSIYGNSGTTLYMMSGRLASIGNSKGSEAILDGRKPLAESIAYPVVRSAKLTDITTRSFDAAGRLLKETYADGSERIYAGEKLIQETDGDGSFAEYEYTAAAPYTVETISQYIIPAAVGIDYSILTPVSKAHTVNPVNPAYAFGTTAWQFEAKSWGVTKLAFSFNTDEAGYAVTEDIFYVDVRVKPRAAGVLAKTVNVIYDDLGKAIDLNMGDILVL
ncbi:MAG: hypothetical protein Q8R48_07070, partial [Candidatus Omnitrophota bacterium]|nr:hypothetical protein [Candidatus Omnitrophota bacterium]